MLLSRLFFKYSYQARLTTLRSIKTVEDLQAFFSKRMNAYYIWKDYSNLLQNISEGPHKAEELPYPKSIIKLTIRPLLINIQDKKLRNYFIIDYLKLSFFETTVDSYDWLAEFMILKFELEELNQQFNLNMDNDIIEAETSILQPLKERLEEALANE